VKVHEEIREMENEMPLPPGQTEVESFPRFGLAKFAERFPHETENVAFDIKIAGENITRFTDELSQLERIQQVSDFHCVTTWTKRNINWSGYRFSEFYTQFILNQIKPDVDINFVVFRCQDGYRVGMCLEDLKNDDVLLAYGIDEQPLGIAHGAPLRLVAPAHYGYKNAKHIASIEFLEDANEYRPSGLKFMDHPRARVAMEERGTIFPGWFLRRLYRPLINSTVAKFSIGLAKHESSER
jgi:DMSO/TMAO reductase YedYZ molybdopterin-dependent catalytic subunit